MNIYGFYTSQNTKEIYIFDGYLCNDHLKSSWREFI